MPQVSWKIRAGGFVAAKTIQTWMRTMRYRALFHDRDVDPCYPADQPRIYVFWHEYILIPLFLRGNCNLAMLLSRHKDADILAQVAGHVGFDCVRGSTNKGAAAALLELKRRGEHMHLAITPDGPRGPRRELARGPIYLASKLGLPIVPLGFGYANPWRAKSWDRFAIPKPFSKTRAIIGPEIYIPADLDRAALEIQRLYVQQQLTDLTVEAEDWAASGTHREGEVCEGARALPCQIKKGEAGRDLTESVEASQRRIA